MVKRANNFVKMNKAILDELEIGQEWYQPLQLVFAKYDINTPRRQACFIGQCQVESDNFKVLEENLNYSAERLMQIFPSRLDRKSTRLNSSHT